MKAFRIKTFWFAILLLVLAVAPTRGQEIRLGSNRFRYPSPVLAIGYINAGKELIVAEGGSVRILDVKTGDELRGFDLGAPIRAASIVDNTIALLTGYAGDVEVWDLVNGARVTRFKSHEAGNLRVCLSPDCKIVAVAGLDWRPNDQKNGKERFPGRVPSGDDYSIRLWNVASGKQLAAFPNGLKTGLNMAFSPDSKQLVWSGSKEIWWSKPQSVFAGDGGDTIQLGNLTDGKMLFEIKARNAGLAFTPDGKMLAISGEEVMLLDLKNPKAPMKACARAGYGVPFSPDGTRIATFTNPDRLVIWNVATGKETARSSYVWHGNIYGGPVFVFAPDGKTLAGSVGDGTVRIWDTSSAKQIGGMRDADPMRDAVITPDGTTVITAQLDGKLRWWDVGTRKIVHTENRFTDPTRNEESKIWLSRDGATLYCLARTGFQVQTMAKGTLSVWDVATRKQLPCALKPVRDLTRGVAMSPDRTLLATGASDGTIYLWDLKTGASVSMKGHTGLIQSLVFSADGKQLLSGGGEIVPLTTSPPETDSTVRLWDVEKRQEIRTVFKTTHPVEVVIMAPDGKWALCNMWTPATQNSAFRLDLVSGKTAAPLGEHFCAAISPDGKRLAVSSWTPYNRPRGGPIQLFDTESWKLIAGFSAHTDTVQAISFSADGRFLVTAGQDCTAVVWDLTKLPK